jgi:hypothetical protein
MMVASTHVVAMWWGGTDVWPFDAVTPRGGPLERAAEISLDGRPGQTYGGEPPTSMESTRSVWRAGPTDSRVRSLYLREACLSVGQVEPTPGSRVHEA